MILKNGLKKLIYRNINGYTIINAIFDGNFNIEDFLNSSKKHSQPDVNNLT